MKRYQGFFIPLRSRQKPFKDEKTGQGNQSTPNAKNNPLRRENDVKWFGGFLMWALAKAVGQELQRNNEPVTCDS